MADVCETAKTAVFDAGDFEAAPAHGVDFVAGGAEVGRRETAEGNVV